MVQPFCLARARRHHRLRRAGPVIAIAALSLSAAPALAAAAVSAAPPPPAHSNPPAVVGGAIQEEWTATDGASLSATLTGWAQRAGWTVVWETDDDFRLAAGGALEGDFPTAAGGLIEAFSHARPRLRAIFYAGNKVLRVWTERNEP